jgi:hypothetical protein
MVYKRLVHATFTKTGESSKFLKKRPIFLPFEGHKLDCVSKLPFINMIIQKFHGFDAL